ncbi:MAG: hypothetical protein M1814_001382 [Vezdaea aestivalis]|nr:MAG: hypothetical protein M1814_001382 [Vezdaea aestivalis]
MCGGEQLREGGGDDGRALQAAASNAAPKEERREMGVEKPVDCGDSEGVRRGRTEAQDCLRLRGEAGGDGVAGLLVIFKTSDELTEDDVEQVDACEEAPSREKMEDDEEDADEAREEE